MFKFSVTLSALLRFSLLLQTYAHALPLHQNQTTPNPTTVITTNSTSTDATSQQLHKNELPAKTEAPTYYSNETNASPLHKINKLDYTADKYEVVDVSHGKIDNSLDVGGVSGSDVNNGIINKLTMGQTTRIYTTGAVDDEFWLKHLGDDFKNAIHLHVGGSDHYNELIKVANDTQVHHEFLAGSDLLSLGLPYETSKSFSHFLQTSMHNSTDKKALTFAAHNKQNLYQPFQKDFAINVDSGGIGINMTPKNQKRNNQRAQAHNTYEESISGYGQDANNEKKLDLNISAHVAPNLYDQALTPRNFDTNMILYHKAILSASKSLSGSNDNSSLAAGSDNGYSGKTSLLPYILRKPVFTYDAERAIELPFKSHLNDYLNRKHRKVQKAYPFERGL